MSLEKEHPRNAGKPRCERCNVLLTEHEVITCDPCAAGLCLYLADSKTAHLRYGDKWPARQQELRSEAASLRLASTRHAWQWAGVISLAEAKRGESNIVALGGRGDSLPPASRSYGPSNRDTSDTSNDRSDG